MLSPIVRFSAPLTATLCLTTCTPTIPLSIPLNPLACRGTGTASEMAIPERESLAYEGVVVVAVDVMRPRSTSAPALGSWSASSKGAAGSAMLACRARLTTRGMWTDQGRLMEVLKQVWRSVPRSLCKQRVGV